MKRRIDYEARMTRMAAQANRGRPLREGPRCLICQCWKKPCGACQKAAGAPHRAKPDLDELIRRAMS